MTENDHAEFRATLEEAGYTAATKSMDPSMELDAHTHDFDVWAQVTAGEINITVDGETTRYGSGDQFVMAAGCVHSEVVGPEGVTFVVGRRQP